MEFLKKNAIFCRELAKIAENNDHIIYPRVREVQKTLFKILSIPRSELVNDNNMLS
jgi:hypothetical protein